MIAFRLASGGWWNGNPTSVLMAPADEVMLAVQYEDFKGGYEAEMVRLARADAT